MQISYTPIDEIKEFNRAGYHCSVIRSENNFYLVSLERDGKVISYEIWKGKRAKQPDGTHVYVRPSDEDFGHYGWSVTLAAKDRVLNSLRAKFPDFPYETFTAAML